MEAYEWEEFEQLRELFAQLRIFAALEDSYDPQKRPGGLLGGFPETAGLPRPGGLPSPGPNVPMSDDELEEFEQLRRLLKQIRLLDEYQALDARPRFSEADTPPRPGGLPGGLGVEDFDLKASIAESLFGSLRFLINETVRDEVERQIAEIRAEAEWNIDTDQNYVDSPARNKSIKRRPRKPS